MKNMGLLLATAALTIAAGLTAQSQRTIEASKKYVTKPVAASVPFKSLALTGIVDVEFTQSTNGRTEMSVYGSDNLVNLVELTNSNGTLTVGFPRKIRISGERRLKLIVSAPTLSGVRISGTGDADLKGELKTGNFTIYISGTGDVTCGSLTAQNVKTAQTGSGDIEIKSLRCGDLLLSSTGTGDIEMGKTDCGDFVSNQKGTGDVTIKSISCNNFTATTEGTGDFEANVTSQGRVIASTTSTGDITLSGKAEHARLVSSGTGDIEADKFTVTSSAVVATSGTGDISCRVTGKLTATATGTGIISYSGNPAATELNGRIKNIRKR